MPSVFIRVVRRIVVGVCAAALIGAFAGTPAALAATTERPDAQLRQILRAAVNDASSFRDRFDAEVWLMDMAGRLKKRVPDPQHRLNLLKLVHYEATRAELPPELVLAVIQVESNFDRWALSSVGAQGLMQIMPFWLEEVGRPNDNLFRPEINVRMGCTILRYYLDREKGDFTRALARYNGSLGSTRYPNKVFAALRNRWYRR